MAYLNSDELKAVLRRNMHRTSLTDADLDRAITDTVFEYNAKSKRGDTVNLQHLLTYQPQLLFHGSMRNLSILAQDDDQLARHDPRFQDAIRAADWQRSTEQVVPDPLLTEVYYKMRFQPAAEPGGNRYGIDRSQGADSYGAADGTRPGGYELVMLWESLSRLQLVLGWDDPASDARIIVGAFNEKRELLQESMTRYVTYELGWRDKFMAAAQANEWVELTFQWRIR